MTKSVLYKTLSIQIKSLITEESDTIANLGNIASVLHFAFGHHWTGFYIVKNKELVLGPFQGPVACTRIAFGKGVCGMAWKQAKSIIVDDVHQFDGHIACSALTNSEIVIPIFRDNKVWGVLDIDSTQKGTFDQTDDLYLKEICSWLQVKGSIASLTHKQL